MSTNAGNGTPRKDSQFAGAAALFRAKENGIKSPTKTPASGKPTWNKVNGHNSASKLNTGGFLSTPGRIGNRKNSSVNSLAPPPFVSPGTKGRSAAFNKGATSPPAFVKQATTKQPTPTTPKQTAKPTVGFGGLPFSPTSPSPPSGGGGGKPKARWKDKGGGISFQAASPGALNKPSIKPALPTPTYFGGSYINKGANTTKSATATTTTTNKPKVSSGGMPEAQPDITIQVNSDIQEKIKARRANISAIPKVDKHENVPEHIRKAREREERLLRAEEEKEYRSASLVQAAFLGWHARVQYPKLVQANAERLRQMRQQEAEQKRRLEAILTIQKTFRMYIPRKRYVLVRDCKRRREKNLKEMKKISKIIEKMPQDTKKEIKDLKKEYAEKKKDMKKQVKKRLKEEDKKIAELKKQGQSMVDYMKAENEKIKKQKEAIKADQKLLEQQTDLLKQKSEEIAKNFASLQAWVDKKQAVIKQHEVSDQKCRHRYLPKYRQDMADRNQHCVAEYRVKELYRKRLKKIVKEIEAKSTDPKLVQEVQKQVKDCKKELKKMPEIPIPSGLEERLKEAS